MVKKWSKKWSFFSLFPIFGDPLQNHYWTFFVFKKIKIFLKKKRVFLTRPQKRLFSLFFIVHRLCDFPKSHFFVIFQNWKNRNFSSFWITSSINIYLLFSEITKNSKMKKPVFSKTLFLRHNHTHKIVQNHVLTILTFTICF